MNFTVVNDDYKRNALEYCNNQPVPFNLSIDPLKQLKTKNQLGFIFGGLIKSLQGYFKELNGGEFDSESLKCWLYAKCGVYEPILFPDNTTHHQPKTLSKMTKQEAAEFINRVINFIDNETDCILLPELRYCWLLHVTQKELDFAGTFKFPEKSPDYIAFQHTLTCINCGAFGTEAHHVRHNTGLAKKPDDYKTIPLCRNCHNKLQSCSGSELKKRLPIYGFEVETFCRLAYIRWYYKK